ncbi:MAG: S-layer protein [Paenibacillus sp.]|nr:S-layer protein [Paenibacillus sp.]
MKKSLPVLLTAAMAFSMFSSVALGAGNGKSSADFSDLSHLDAASKVKFDALISAGIFDGVGGEGTFGLNDKMNRAQFAKAAALIFGLPVDASLNSSSFADVSAGDPANGYALPYIEALKKANLTDGSGANLYNPAGEVTKEQLAAFLIRGLNKEAEAKEAQGTKDPTVSDWAQGYAALAHQLKLMENGADGMFGGTTAATRELLVTSSYEAKQQYIPVSGEAMGEASGSSSGDVQLSAGETPSYAITDNTRAQVKGVLQEKLANGWRFGAAVELTNTSNSNIRIPDYELRVKSSDGAVYTLKASTGNAHSIDPQSKVELNYMTEIDKISDVQLTDLLWIDVDLDVYPQKETLLADAPIGSIVWRGADADIQDPSLMGSWGASFTVPGEASALKYSATNLTKQFSGQSPTYIVQVLVENTDSYAVTVPEFTLSGKAEGRSFIGKRVETSPITVNPGEKKYFNFAITTEPDTQLTAFYVLSSHSFLKQGATSPLQYYTGRIGFRTQSPEDMQAALPSYTIGQPIAIDSLSNAVNPQLAVALQDFDWFENDGQSYKTAVAKLKYTNTSDSSIPVPQLGAEIVSNEGTSYNGVQVPSTVNDVLPGMGAVRSYAFTVPKSVETHSFTLRLLEQQVQQAQPAQQGQQQNQQPAYKTPISQVHVAMRALNPVGNQYSFYPYELTMDNFNITNYSTKNAITNAYTYNYKLEMGLTIKTTDQVINDPSNPKLLFQLEGPDGKRLGSKTFPLAGDNRLMNGNQSIMFDSADDTLQSPISIKVYEVVTTPYGEARRLLATLKD